MLSIRGTTYCVLSTLIALKPVVAIKTVGSYLPPWLSQHMIEEAVKNEGVWFTSGPEALATIADEIRARIHERGTDNDDWTFVDLGCGKGSMVQLMAKSQMFQHIVGVELDQDACQEAQRMMEDTKTSDIVCSDLFEFVHNAYSLSESQKPSLDAIVNAIVNAHQGHDIPWNPNMPGELAGRKTVFYMYEPLWSTDFTPEELHQKYCGLLADMAANAQQEVFVVYAPFAKYFKPQQADPECFTDNRFVLRSEIFADVDGYFAAVPQNVKDLIPAEMRNGVQVWHLDPIG